MIPTKLPTNGVLISCDDSAFKVWWVRKHEQVFTYSACNGSGHIVRSWKEAEWSDEGWCIKVFSLNTPSTFGYFCCKDIIISNDPTDLVDIEPLASLS